MTDIKSNLVKDSDDSFDVNDSSDGADEKMSKEQIQDTVEENFGKTLMSEEEQGNNSSDGTGKRRFSNFRRMVNGLRSNRKERTDSEKSTVIGDSQKTNKLFGKSNTSTISRMWNSLFPNKESPEMTKSSSGDEAPSSNIPENRSTKTLGRMFSPRMAKDYSAKSDPEEIPRPKSSTLGRITQGLRQFKVAESSSSVPEDIPNPIMSPPTTSLEHGNITPTPV